MLRRVTDRLNRNYNRCMSWRFVLVSCCALLAFVPRSSAQDISRAYCGKDGKAHLVYRDDSVKTLRSEPKQVGCQDIVVTADGRTVGWSVLVENCCTSYPIPTSIVVYSGNRRTIISVGQMVWEWRFIDAGKRVAVLSGPVHGEAAEANLYDAHSGKTVATWGGEGTAPDWAADWKQQFAKAEQNIP